MAFHFPVHILEARQLSQGVQRKTKMENDDDNSTELSRQITTYFTR